MGAGEGGDGSADRLAEGMVIEDTYRLERRLGAGAMGEVWKAQEISTDISVALKFLKRQGQQDLDQYAAAAFEQEQSILRDLRGQHVVRIRGRGTYAGLPYFVMDFLEGGTLQAHLRRRGRLPWREVLEIIHEVAEGLAELHAHGFVHRDLKPGNIFLQPVGQRIEHFIIDLGLARPVERSNDSGPMTELLLGGLAPGTPSFMAPEQFANRPVPASDLYGLGVIAFLCLTGGLPSRVRGPGLASPMMATLAHVDAPEEVRAVVAQLLADDPAARFGGSADLVADHVNELLVLLDRPPASPLKAPSTSRRAALGLAVVAVLGLGLGVVSRHLLRDREVGPPPTPEVHGEGPCGPSMGDNAQDGALRQGCMGAVVIRLDPPDSSVSLVRASTGAASIDDLNLDPGGRASLPAGEHTLRAHRAGCRPREVDVTVPRGGQTDVELRLECENFQVAGMAGDSKPRPEAARVQVRVEVKLSEEPDLLKRDLTRAVRACLPKGRSREVATLLVNVDSRGGMSYSGPSQGGTGNSVEQKLVACLRQRRLSGHGGGLATVVVRSL
jgi:serine/threonine protein kinase